MTDPEPGTGARLRRVADSVMAPFTRPFWTTTRTILGILAAGATLVTFVLEVVLPRSEACDTNAATLTTPVVHEGTFQEFLEQTSGTDVDPTEGIDPEQLDDRVKWVSVAISVLGHKGNPLSLRWSMIDAAAPAANDLPRNRWAAEFRPPGCQRTGFREEVLLTPVPPGRRVYVGLDLVDAEGNSLPREEVRTEIIRGAS